MELEPFKLERYFAKYEFSTKYLLSPSDCEGMPQSRLLAMADSQSIKLWDNLTLGYTESAGHPLLREEIAKLYNGVHPNQVLVVAPEEGIFIALNTILRSGDHVICTYPGYQSLYEVAEGLGCDVTGWLPDEEEGWRFNPKFLEEAIRPKTKLIIVNFPHNPTGYLPPEEDSDQIAEIAREGKIPLFSDGMYRGLEYNPQDRLPSGCELNDQSVTLSGMSKVFGMAGVRIGWLITQDSSLYQKMAQFKDYTTICSSAPSEILSLIALRNKETIISENLERIGRNLKLLDGFFERNEDLFSWIRPKAGTICFPRLKNALNSHEFCEKVVQDTGVMLLPSSVYDFGYSHLRLGFGRENMPEALEVFENYLKKQSPKR